VSHNFDTEVEGQLVRKGCRAAALSEIRKFSLVRSLKEHEIVSVNAAESQRAVPCSDVACWVSASWPSGEKTAPTMLREELHELQFIQHGSSAATFVTCVYTVNILQ